MTLYPFFSSIPQASDVPSNSQSQILTNNGSVSGWSNVDHVGYNLNNGGIHRMMTFLANMSSPAIQSGATAVEYINSLAGMQGTVSTLYFKNATKDVPLTNLPLVTGTAGATGYGFTTPWGLIINAGFAMVGTTLTTFTFQVPMNTTGLTLQATASSNTIRTVNIFDFFSSTFKVQASANGTGFWFFAMGY